MMLWEESQQYCKYAVFTVDAVPRVFVLNPFSASTYCILS